MTPEDKVKIAQLLITIHKLSEGIDKLMSLIDVSYKEGTEGIKKLKKEIDTNYSELLELLKNDF